MMKWTVIVLMLCSFNIRGQEEDCCTPFPKDPACGCTFEDGTTVDLSSIGCDNGLAAFKLEPFQDGFIYYNPCYPFNISSGCINVALCFEERNRGDIYSLGAQNPSFIATNDNVIILYSGGANGRISEVALKCGSGAPSFSFVELNFKKGYYNFTLTTSAACFGLLTGYNSCFEPSHASKCKIWCIVSAAGVAVGLLIIIIIIILWILCRRKRCKGDYESIGTDKKQRSAATKFKVTGTLDTKPKYTELKKIFDDKVGDWKSVCPYLINDEDGQKTREIRKNGTNVEERRDEMLTVFLKQSTPTWQKVIDALREGKYNSVADDIKEALLAIG